VFLDGEAFFDVAHNAKKPFTVQTDKQKISVLGTVFNVMDYSTDDYAVTTLISGSVKVQPVNEAEAPGKIYILKPNQQVFINKTLSEATLTNVKIDPDRTWVNKIYHFHDEPLIRIMQRLEKFYGVKIDFADEKLQNEKYTGTFPTNITIDEILKIINYEKQFTYTIKDEIITISSNHKK
jgi:ferric-dicitrate binding protein FerR (iron transport regulator)